MSADFPQLIDPWQAAANGARFSGVVVLAESERLGDKLAWPPVEAMGRDETLGLARFVAEFSRDAMGRPCIDLHVDAQVPLRCQRTLKFFTETLSSDSRIVIVRDEDEAERVDEALEPFLLEEKQLSLRQLVEEEVLLALPLVPVDPATAPAPEAVAPATPEGRQKPFAALAGLLRTEARSDSDREDMDTD